MRIRTDHGNRENGPHFAKEIYTYKQNQSVLNGTHTEQTEEQKMKSLKILYFPFKK